LEDVQDPVQYKSQYDKLISDLNDFNEDKSTRINVNGATQPTAAEIDLYANLIANHKMAPSDVSSFSRAPGFRPAVLALAQQKLEAQGSNENITDLEQQSQQYRSASWNTAVRANETVMPNLERVINLVGKIPNGRGIAAVDKVIQGAGIQFGNVPLSSMQSLKDIIATELGNSVGGSNVTSDAARNQALEALRTAGTPEQVMAALQTVRSMELSRHSALMSQVGGYGQNRGDNWNSQYNWNPNTNTAKDDPSVKTYNLTSNAPLQQKLQGIGMPLTTYYQLYGQAQHPNDPDYQKAHDALVGFGLIK
jgi:hypothetical protein